MGNACDRERLFRGLRGRLLGVDRVTLAQHGGGHPGVLFGPDAHDDPVGLLAVEHLFPVGIRRAPEAAGVSLGIALHQIANTDQPSAGMPNVRIDAAARERARSDDANARIAHFRCPAERRASRSEGRRPSTAACSRDRRPPSPPRTFRDSRLRRGERRARADRSRHCRRVPIGGQSDP